MVVVDHPEDGKIWEWSYEPKIQEGLTFAGADAPIAPQFHIVRNPRRGAQRHVRRSFCSAEQHETREDSK